MITLRTVDALLIGLGWLVVIPAFYAGQHVRAFDHVRGIHRGHRRDIKGGRAALACLVVVLIVVAAKVTTP